MGTTLRVIASLVGTAAVATVVMMGCSSDDSTTDTSDAGPGGSAAGGTAGSSSGGSSTGGSGGSSTGGSAGKGAGGSSTGGSSTGGSSTGGSSTGGSSTGGSGGGSDPFAAARQLCIDHINELRATKGREAYQRWTSAETCVDEEATYDSTHGPHAAFMDGNTCGAYAQGECPGSGPDNVVGCIDLMWAESQQDICAGCDACPSVNDGWSGNCPNCHVQTSSPTCGHYLALVVASFTSAACGFSTAGAYTAINFQ